MKTDTFTATDVPPAGKPKVILMLSFMPKKQCPIEPFLHANHGSNLFLQQVKTIAAPTQTVPWVRDVGVRMVHMKERLCFRSGVRPGKRHLQDVERS